MVVPLADTQDDVIEIPDSQPADDSAGPHAAAAAVGGEHYAMANFAQLNPPPTNCSHIKMSRPITAGHNPPTHVKARPPTLLEMIKQLQMQHSQAQATADARHEEIRSMFTQLHTMTNTGPPPRALSQLLGHATDTPPRSPAHTPTKRGRQTSTDMNALNTLLEQR
jgi:hypothetical protein